MLFAPLLPSLSSHYKPQFKHIILSKIGLKMFILFGPFRLREVRFKMKHKN